MSPIEDRIRTSLQQRAEDVEPTPALWQEVDRRITRRRWRTVGVWSLAGVAAALAAVVVVPGLVGSTTPTPEIGGGVPGGPAPAIAVSDGAGLGWLDLRSGTVTPLDGSGGTDDVGRIEQIAVRPGSTPGDHDIVAVRVRPDGFTELLVDVARPDQDGLGSMGQLSEHERGFVPSVAFSPDGSMLAITIPSVSIGGGDGTTVVLRPYEPGEFPELGLATATSGVSYASVELDGMATIVGWSDAASGSDAVSTLYVRPGDAEERSAGPLVAVDIEVADDGTALMTEPRPVVAGEAGTVEAMAVDRSGTAARTVQLLRQADGMTLEVSHTSGASEGVFPVGSGGDGYTLHTAGDAILVFDGERAELWSWTLNDGLSGGQTLPVTTTAVALFDLPGGIAAPDDPTTDEPEVDEPATDDGAGDDQGETDGPVEGPAVVATDEPVLLAGTRELYLLRDGERELLYQFDPEGEARIIEVAVRPGSTPEDLTAVVLTAAEGMMDLRVLEVVDGQVTGPAVPLEGQYGPGLGREDRSSFSITGPVWYEDGSSLAWLEFDGQDTELRIIGWDEGGPGTGDPATDNASFALDDAPEGVRLLPSVWTSSLDDDGATEIRVTLDDPVEGWYSLPLVRQGDGSWSQAVGASVVRAERGGEGLDGWVLAVAAPQGDLGVPAWVSLGDGGAQLVLDPYATEQGGEPQVVALPGDLLPGEGLPELWLERVGDSWLVGSRNMATAYLVDPAGDGEPLRLEDVGSASTIR
jgi:hypothetical protein